MPPKITPKLIRIMRQKLGETQETFGKRFGVNQATISRWEREGIKSATGIKLSRRVVDELLERMPT